MYHLNNLNTFVFSVAFHVWISLCIIYLNTAAVFNLLVYANACHKKQKFAMFTILESGKCEIMLFLNYTSVSVFIDMTDNHKNVNNPLKAVHTKSHGPQWK